MNYMKAVVIPVTPLQENCSLLCCEETGKAVVIDPGGDIDQILAAVKENSVEIEKILVTHAHIDHIGAVAELVNQFNLPIEGPHRDDKFWIDSLPEQAETYGITAPESFEPDRWLVQDDKVNFGNIELDVHHCPGHTPGHIIFFHPESRLAIVGDVLFKGSIGRTDFPKGDHQTLIESIQKRLWPLGDDVQFIPGHGPTSTFGYERQTNLYFSDQVI
jgi:glyoxylase-like metal-dependent hydrolase (beta-lactamase superfamily II)